jgi:hypothetical protein
MVPDNLKSDIHKIKRVTPGPGHYQPPSDFGYLNLFKYSPRTSQSPRNNIQYQRPQKMASTMKQRRQSENNSAMGTMPARKHVFDQTM